MNMNKKISVLFFSIGLFIAIYGCIDVVFAEGIAPDSVVDSVFTDPDSSNWYYQGDIYYVESVLYWLEDSSNYASYGNYYVCEIHDDQYNTDST